VNLYGFVGNDGIGKWDYLGREFGAGLQVGGGSWLYVLGSTASVTIMPITTKCRLCVSISFSLSIGPGIGFFGGAGIGGAINPGNDLNGASINVAAEGFIAEGYSGAGNVSLGPGGAAAGGGIGGFGIGVGIGAGLSLNCTGCTNYRLSDILTGLAPVVLRATEEAWKECKERRTLDLLQELANYYGVK
jgi:hypothetical protein